MNADLINTLLLFGIALFNALAAYWAYKSRVASEAAATTAAASAVNIQKIETSTNSMKDELVKVTGEAALAKGTAEGLEKGRKEGISEPQFQQQAQRPGPLPVADDRTATATERTASASERVADAAERSADKAEK